MGVLLWAKVVCPDLKPWVHMGYCSRQMYLTNKYDSDNLSAWSLVLTFKVVLKSTVPYSQPQAEQVRARRKSERSSRR
jgi:hypothetical protein